MSEDELCHARKLLDKALADHVRAERLAGHFGTIQPLYLPEIRWEMVRLARRMLGEDVCVDP